MTAFAEHEHIQLLLGAYALDAVEADEGEVVEQHLRRCPRCRDEVRTIRETAALLAHTGGPAPPGLWPRIVAGLEEAAAPPPLRLVSPRQRQPSRVRRLLVGVAAAAVVGALTVGLLRDATRISHLEAAQRGSSLARAALAAEHAPGSRALTLLSPDRRLAVDAVVGADGAGYLLAGKLPFLDARRTYQLWGFVGSAQISLGVLGPRPGIVAFHLSGPVWSLAITDEEAGGASSPRGQPLLTGMLTGISRGL